MGTNLQETFHPDLFGTFYRNQSIMKHDIEISTDIFVSQLTEKMISCAYECGIKTIRKNSKVKTTNSPWFDKECAGLKKEMQYLAKSLKHCPDTSIIRTNLYCLKKKFSSLIKKKKNAYKFSIIDEMKLCGRSEPKKFWKLLDRISINSPNKNEPNNITMSTWTNHFKSVLTSKREVVLPTHNVKNGPLDYVFTMGELVVATEILKNGKCPGLDNISNEMLICLFDSHPKLLLSLFNRILDTECTVPIWYTAVIAPIFKKGNPNDADNYRGISLLSCLAKLFYTLLNNRLLKYCRDYNILSPSQLGFLPGNRTTDAHLIIYNIIRKYCHIKGKKLYGCFVDFSKAFDTIPPDTLFNKLIAYGITGKFLKAITNLYSNDKACIKIGDKISDDFDINQGVRQGCVLSPLLFNIFISDLPKHLCSDSDVILYEGHKINCLLWADDLVMLSESEVGLQSLLHHLYTYCSKNEVTVNLDKSKCMIFNKTGKLMRNPFYLGGEKLENVRSYKYLGLIFTPSGEVKSALDDLRSRGLKAYWNLKKKMGVCFHTHIKETLHLFDSLIKPILLYGSDFWGCLPMPKNNPIENVYRMFCKHILGVHKSTHTEGVLLELGRLPLTLFQGGHWFWNLEMFWKCSGIYMVLKWFWN